MKITPTNVFRPADYLTVPLRLALGLSFLFAVADRLGILGPPGTPGVSWGSFSKFLAYNAQVNSFAPAAIRDFLGVAGTFFETIFGLGLVLGVATRLTAIGSGSLLFLYGIAMAISFGIESRFNYSVFSAMAGALLLAAWGRYPLCADALWQWGLRFKRPRCAHKYEKLRQLAQQQGVTDAQDECDTHPQTRWA